MSAEVVYIRRFRQGDKSTLLQIFSHFLRRLDDTKITKKKRFDRDLLTMKFVLPLAVLLCGRRSSKRGLRLSRGKIQEDT
jgi:hypothetical protein